MYVLATLSLPAEDGIKTKPDHENKNDPKKPLSQNQEKRIDEDRDKKTRHKKNLSSQNQKKRIDEDRDKKKLDTKKPLFSKPTSSLVRCNVSVFQFI